MLQNVDATPNVKTDIQSIGIKSSSVWGCVAARTLTILRKNVCFTYYSDFNDY